MSGRNSRAPFGSSCSMNTKDLECSEQINLNARTVGASVISNFDSLELNKNDELVAEVYQVECSEE